MVQEELSKFKYYVSERANIRIRKEVEKLPPPWTKDPILQMYSFTNVAREHDRVTRWIFENWYNPRMDDPNLSMAACVARVVNWPGTLVELGYPYQWDEPHFVRVLAKRKAEGKKVWTGAYMVTGGYSAGGESKEAILGRVLSHANEVMPAVQYARTLKEAAQIMSPINGMGDFLNAQVIADLKHTPVLKHATDWYDWCAPGPGSLAGATILMGDKVTPSKFIDVVKRIREAAGLEHLCLQNVQNCLCEFSKYHRGYSRSKYDYQRKD